jgi:hypothetical protein
MFDRLAIVAVIVAMLSSLMLLVSQNWRRVIIALSVQYIAVFWLASLTWPVGLAVAKLVAGWMAGAVLASSQQASALEDEKYTGVSGYLFKGVAAILIWMVAFSIAPELVAWLPAKMPILWGGMILIGMGLLQLGMTTRPFKVALGLLTVLSGFEILYSFVETSVLVAGLLVMITLGLALAGAYLLASRSMEETQ